MNFILAWFQEWSDLEKDDFVPVLGDTLASKHSLLNGEGDGENHINSHRRKRPSLFSCQVSLYRTWIHGWSDDQKSYLILRLKEIDQNFGKKYESYQLYGKDSPEKDYFEPGIPAELDRSSEKGSNCASLNTSVDDEIRAEGRPEIIFKVADNTNLPDLRSSRLDELNSELDKFKKLEILDHKPDLDPGHSVEEAEDALESCSADDDDSSLRDADCLSPIAEGTEE